MVRGAWSWRLYVITCLSSIGRKFLCLGCGVKEETDVISKVKVGHGYYGIEARSPWHQCDSKIHLVSADSTSEGEVTDENELRGGYPLHDSCQDHCTMVLSLTLASFLTVFVEGSHNERPPVSQIALDFGLSSDGLLREGGGNAILSGQDLASTPVRSIDPVHSRDLK